MKRTWFENWPMQRLLFTASLVATLLGLAAFAGSTFYFLQTLVTEASVSRLNTGQIIFRDAVTNDILTGLNSEVYRKCKLLFNSGTITRLMITGSDDRPICDLSNPTVGSEGTRHLLTITTPVFFDESETSRAGTIRAVYADDTTSRILTRSIATLSAIATLLAVVLGFATRHISRAISIPISELSKTLSSADLPQIIAKTGGEARSAIPEVRSLYSATSALASRLLTLESERIKKSKAEALAALAAQVAHDIRSPLAALDAASGDAAKLPEEQRVLIRSAVGRIRDIANSLLDKQRAQTAGEPGSGGPSSSGLLLSGLIESLITEKRLQYRSRPGVEIEAWLDAPSYGIFARVQPVEFKRLLSNLINNAVEAFEDGAGSVRVTLSARDGEALIMVRDDGKGIPLNLLSKLGKRGETHGKSGGSGLGLYHARISAESWGGSLEIASEPPKKGAVITVRLPLAQAPDWFVSELVLTADRAVVILDDDASIHRVWDDRLGDLRDRGVEVVHVSAPDELRKWCEENTGKSRGARYLLDFELLGYEDTGLSLADELDIAARSVLVTSRYEEARVLEECARLKIRMIPKGLAGFVPISLTPARERPDAVLIDDDPLVRMVWTTAAKKAGASLRCCDSLTEFETIRSEIGKAVPVYLDWDLGEPAGGRPALDRLRELGFKEIHIATGHDLDSLPPMKGISSVRGKEPPWA